MSWSQYHITKNYPCLPDLVTNNNWSIFQGNDETFPIRALLIFFNCPFTTTISLLPLPIIFFYRYKILYIYKNMILAIAKETMYDKYERFYIT